MKSTYDSYCFDASKRITKSYSTSFYAGVKCLDKNIRKDIHSIYGLVRFADEIVDTFHNYNKEELLSEFKQSTFEAIERGISLNPVLHSFQATVNKYQIDQQLIEQFFYSMEMDLKPVEYDQSKYDEYILGSAQVVGLMCLKIFVNGNNEKYEELKPYAMKLGSAFQKINFLRDLKNDINELGRIYFPNIDTDQLNLEDKVTIEKEIENEFSEAKKGIKQLPKSSRLGVYISFVYYTNLLKKIKSKSPQELMKGRIRVSDTYKTFLFVKSYIKNSLNIL